LEEVSTLGLSTLTVSSINGAVPGTGAGISAFSTLTVSSLVSVSSIQSASTMYTSTLDASGIIQGQTAFQSNTNANNVGMGALQTVYLGQYGAAAPRGTSVRIGDVLGAAYYLTTGSYNLSFYKDVSGGNAVNALQIIGIGATNTSPNIYIPNSLGIGTATTQAKLHLDNGSTQGLNALFYASGLGAGQNTSIAVGKAFSTANSGTILWNHVSDGSTSNFLGLGAFGGDNKMNILASGNVGIGITTPSDLLVVNSGNIAINTATNTAAGYLFNQGSVWGGVEVEGNVSTGAQTLNFGVNMNRTKAWNSSYGGLFLRVDSRTGSNYNGFHFFNRSAPSGTDTEIMTILSGGNVGIGTVNPGYALHVIGAIYASGNITALSDQRYKQNIVRLADCLGKVSRLSAYQYTRTDYLPGVTQIGLIAQEVNDVFPEAVSHDVTNDTYSLNYGCLIAPVIESIKEIDQKVDSRVAALESKIAAQQVLIQQLLDRLG